MSATIPDDTDYHRPDDIDDVHDLLDEHGDDAKIVAGGQSLLLLLRQDMLDPAVIIDITGVDRLVGIEESGETVRIGATTTYTDLEESRIVEQYPLLGDAVEVIADKQVRNMGTIGGAVSHADPYLDILPPLLCLDATVEISRSDERRSVPLEEFCWSYLETDLESNEVVEAITFEQQDLSGSYRKVSNIHGGWATVGVATAVSVSDGAIETIRVALAGVDDTPVRASAVESELTGTTPTSETVSEAAPKVTEDIFPLDDPTGSAEYKAKLARNLTAQGIHDAIDSTGGVQ